MSQVVTVRKTCWVRAILANPMISGQSEIVFYLTHGEDTHQYEQVRSFLISSTTVHSGSCLLISLNTWSSRPGIDISARQKKL